MKDLMEGVEPEPVVEEKGEENVEKEPASE